MNKYSLSVLKKWLFRCWSSTVMILLLAIIAAPSSFGQIVTQGASVQANFGIDADLYSGYQLVSPLSGFVAGSDDWFKDEGLDNAGGTPVFAPTEAQIATWYNAIMADDNTAFTMRMSDFNHIPRNTKIGSITWIDGVYRRDNNSTQGGADDVFVSDADKNADNPSTWDIGWKSTPQKNDLIEVMGHMRIEEGIDLDGDGKDDVWGIGAFSTISSDGDSHVDFEFFQNQIEIVGSEIQGLGGQGGRTAWEFDDTDGFVESAGALIVSIDFEGGGTEPYAHVRVWISEDDYNTLNSRSDRPFDIIPGDWNMGDESGVYGYAGIEPKDGADSPAAWAIVNVTEPTLAPPWGTLEGSQATYYDYLQPLQFTEFAINMSYLGLDAFGGDDCNKTLGSLFVKSRSSQEFTAALKDYAGPFLFGYEYTTDVSVQDLKTCVTGAESYVINLEDGVVDDFGGNLSFFENAADTSNLGAAIVNPGSFSVDADDMPKTIYVRSTNADDPDQLCYAVDSFVIDYWPIPVCDITPYDASNIYTYDGAAKVNTPDIVSYSWYTTDGLIGGGATNDSIWGLKGSLDGIEYYVDLEDVNGCTVTCTTTIYAGTYAPPDCTVEVVDATCDGFNDGSAKLQDVPPNWADYDYEWFKLPDEVTVIGTDTMITDLDSGTYKLVITDNNLDVPQSTDCEGTVSDRDPVVLTCPGDYLENACTDATDIKTHFDNWMAGVSVIGSDSMLTTDWDSLTYPDICGDTITVTWTLHDECANPNTCSATFRLPAPDDLVVSDPSDDDTNSSCDYDNQQQLSDAFDSWMSTSLSAIQTELTGQGCDPQVTENDWDGVYPVLCEGDTITVTWTIEDLCDETTVSATFGVSGVDDLVVSDPSDDDTNSSCDYDNQQQLSDAFDSWMSTSLSAIQTELTGQGCDPQVTENDWDGVYPVLCEGDTITVTWTIEDLCDETTVSATFGVSGVDDLVVSDPSDDDTNSSCDYDNQQQLSDAFGSWMSTSLSAIQTELTGQGCDPQVTENDWDGVYPVLCEGDTITVTWTIEDLCDETTVSATFGVSGVDDLVVSDPSDDDTNSSCDYDNQQQLSDAFDSWMSTSLSAIQTELTGQGCDPQVTENDWDGVYPVLCEGDTITVTWTIEDLCDETTVSATFGVSGVDDLVVSDPSDDDTNSSCDYDNQQQLSDAFDSWMSTSLSAIQTELTGQGCDPQVTENDWDGVYPVLCEGDTITVTWTIEDLCDETTVSATFGVSGVDDLVVSDPSDDDTNSSCDYDNQQQLSDAFDSWMSTSLSAIQTELTGQGCDPQVTENDWDGVYPVLCEGDTITVTWTIEDLCDETTVSATFGVSGVDDLVVSDPSDDDTNSSCDYDNQQQLSDAFDSWMSTSLSAIQTELTGQGCDPQVTENDWDGVYPVLCEGDTITVTWTIEDLCDETTVSATFGVSGVDDLVVSDPSDDDTNSSCDYDNQQQLSDAFGSWMSTSLSAIQTELTGQGCDPQVTENDWDGVYPVLCEGDTITVTWTIEDLCDETTVSATFGVSGVDDLVVSDPSDDDTNSSCDYDNQQQLSDAFDSWMSTSLSAIQTELTGQGCDPQVTENDWDGVYPVLCEGDTITVTWTIEDLCDETTVSATFGVSGVDDLVVSDPSDDDTNSSCDYDNQQQLSDAFDSWMSTSLSAIQTELTGQGCDPQVTENDWDGVYPVLCEGDTITVTWTIEDLCDETTVSATFGVSGVDDLVVSDPSDDDTNSSCDYDNQQQLSDAFGSWMSTSLSAIQTELTGQGCDPQVTENDWDGVYPVLCEGDTITVTWTIEDLCDETTVSATFGVSGVDDLVVSDPSDDDTNSSCDYDNQQQLSDAFDSWMSTSLSAIQTELTGQGCDPQVTENDWDGVYPVLCEGDTITVTWTIEDLCDETTVSATFGVSGVDDLVVSDPSDDDTNSSCDYDNQQQLSDAFDSWMSTSLSAIQTELTGQGCDPQVTENDWDGVYPVLCEGDTITVTWTIEDLCDETTVSATFGVSGVDDLVVSDPSDDDTNSSCDYDNQQQLSDAFDSWMSTSLSAIQTELTGQGCDPQVTENDWDGVYPVLCEGDTITVTWTIEDLCDETTVSATFGVSAAPAVTWTEPSDSVNAMCAFEDQAALDLAFDNWLTYVEGIANVSGGCNPVVTNDATDAPNVCLDDTVTVTWTIEDLCETNYFDAKFIVTGDTVKPVITLPTDYEDYVCDIAVPASLTATWTDNCMDGSMNVVSTRELTVDTTCGQTYTYYFEVQDACGNMAKDSLTISREYVSLEECETAFAKLEDELPDPLQAYDPVRNPDPYGLTDDSTAIGSRCFIDDVFNRWGWVNRIREDSTYYLPVYAGAGQCDVSAGYLVGTAELIFEDGTVTVNFDLDDPWVLTEAHVYAGTGMYPLLTKGKKVDATVAPGQYNLVYENGDPLTGFTLDITDASRYIYVIIHAVTCRPTCVCDGTVFDEMDWGTTATAITNSMSTKVKGPKKVETLDYVEGEFNVFPNPFDEAVNFEFVPAVSGHAVLEIHNMLGQRVVRLLDKPVEAGELQRVEFRPETEISGMYLYRLDINGDTRIGKLIYRNK